MANINERICKWNFIIPNEKIMRCLWNELKGERKEGCETARDICCIGRNVQTFTKKSFYIGMESEGGGVNLNL